MLLLASLMVVSSMVVSEVTLSSDDSLGIGGRRLFALGGGGAWKRAWYWKAGESLRPMVLITPSIAAEAVVQETFRGGEVTEAPRQERMSFIPVIRSVSHLVSVSLKSIAHPGGDFVETLNLQESCLGRLLQEHGSICIIRRIGEWDYLNADIGVMEGKGLEHSR